MDNQNKRSKSRRFRKWFKRKQKKADPYPLGEHSDAGEDEDDYMDDAYIRLLDMDPCISTNELRIFVGTWNVAGRSPVGSLAVDLDEWLNLKDAADMYVLGYVIVQGLLFSIFNKGPNTSFENPNFSVVRFQEIVPLKTRNVIGVEDPTEATNWNLLIGKALNHKYGCPWLTPMQNPISSDNYQYVRVPDSERRTCASSHVRTPLREWLRTQSDKPLGGSKYKLMASKKMVGVFISVWLRTELLSKYCISDVKVSSVACGIMGYLGNKGSVSVSLSMEGTSFCFIAAHLASGEKKGDEGRRNHQVSEIFRRTTFPRSSQDDNAHPLTIFRHDRIFWFGDLNYRLYLEDNLARYLIKKQDWKELQQFDQLRKEQEEGGVFQGWKEGNIEFAPTYKYSSSNCNRYSGGLPSRAGEKQRTPAWCDRILWHGKEVKQLSYFRSESKFSDHRPVSALFSTQIEVMKSRNPRATAAQDILSNIMPPKETGKSNSDVEAERTWKHRQHHRSCR